MGMKTVAAVLACAGALLLAGSAMGGAVAEPGTAPELESIIEAVRQREAKVESIRCVMEAKSLVARRPGLEDMVEDADSAGLHPGFRVVDNPMLYQHWSVFLDGGDVRWDKTRRRVYESTGHVSTETYVAIVVEGSARMYFPEHGTGTNAGPGADGYIMAFLTAYRLLTTDLAQARADEMRLVGREEYDGHPCVVVEYPYRIPTQSDYVGGPKRVWLAEDMDWSVVRFVRLGSRPGGYPGGTFQYEQGEDGLWRLVGWHLLADRRRLTMGNEVKELEINVPIGPQVFAFPAGTRVSDRVRNMTYVAGGPDDPNREPSTDEAQADTD